MLSAIVFLTLAFWLVIPASSSMLSSQEAKDSQPVQQTSNSQTPATSQETQTTKPCPTPSESSAAKTVDCKSAHSKRKKHHAQPVASSGAGPTKTVVRNGSTPDPTVAISPDLSDQETSRKLNSTDRLLASADANLKQIANRQLSGSQEDTVKQIKVYMEQARTAAKNGEVQRAYTLANKANMLSADLAAPK